MRMVEEEGKFSQTFSQKPEWKNMKRRKLKQNTLEQYYRRQPNAIGMTAFFYTLLYPLQENEKHSMPWCGGRRRRWRLHCPNCVVHYTKCVVWIVRCRLPAWIKERKRKKRFRAPLARTKTGKNERNKTQIAKVLQIAWEHVKSLHSQESRHSSSPSFHSVPFPAHSSFFLYSACASCVIVVSVFFFLLLLESSFSSGRKRFRFFHSFLCVHFRFRSPGYIMYDCMISARSFEFRLTLYKFRATPLIHTAIFQWRAGLPAPLYTHVKRLNDEYNFSQLMLGKKMRNK